MLARDGDRGYLAAPRGRGRRASAWASGRRGFYSGDSRGRGGSVAQSRGGADQTSYGRSKAGLRKFDRSGHHAEIMPPCHPARRTRRVRARPADRAQEKAPTRQTAGRRRWGDGYASARQYPRASFGGKVLRGLLGATPLGIGKHRAWVGSETTQPPPCRIKLPPARFAYT